MAESLNEIRKQTQESLERARANRKRAEQRHKRERRAGYLLLLMFVVFWVLVLTGVIPIIFKA